MVNTVAPGAPHHHGTARFVGPFACRRSGPISRLLVSLAAAALFAPPSVAGSAVRSRSDYGTGPKLQLPKMVLGSGASVGVRDALSSLSATAFPTVVRQTSGQLDLMTGPYSLASDQPTNCPSSVTVGTEVVVTPTAFAIPPSAMTVGGAKCVADVAGAQIVGVHHAGLTSLAVNVSLAAELQAAHPNGGLGILADGGWTCGKSTVAEDVLVVLFAVASTYTMGIGECTYLLRAGSPPLPPAPVVPDPPVPQPTPAPAVTARPVAPSPEATAAPVTPGFPGVGIGNLPSDTVGGTSGTALPAPGGAACFPAAARVETRAGGHVRVDALRIGDVVRTSADNWSPVYAFSHADAAASAVYVTLTTAAGRLTLTPGHYVPVGVAPAGGNGGDGRDARCAPRTRLVAAGAVRVGDARWSLAPAAANGTAAAAAGGAWVPVTAVAASAAPERRGLYNPHTLDGAVLVDGFAASTYTTALAPRLAEAGLAVARLAYRLGAGEIVGGRLVAALGGVSPPAWAAGAPVS
ncbi:hypothetical protein BU14_0399s0009 [Porphyra umbilicalis]|uniref:Hedgehog protein Hint domain-containing protein n=1 Tax=Porphyra umbilicalis TaxID=2786 RepID=A0A1X6NWD9_PORUM|nr:hypothetical protein BU14_0399s0009 [Porphyra umbilicalis]|eukprot:OSX72865.1 hypothetical protein BU14_0399s0009 [Porphyra umbilicalis]